MDPTSTTQAVADGINSGNPTWAVLAVVGMFLMIAKDIFKIIWAKKEEKAAENRADSNKDTDAEARAAILSSIKDLHRAEAAQTSAITKLADSMTVLTTKLDVNSVKSAADIREMRAELKGSLEEIRRDIDRKAAS